MFIEVLSEQDRAALLATLAHLATASGVVTEAEVGFIAAVAGRLALDAPTDPAEYAQRDIVELVAPVESAESKIVFIMELVNLGHADGEYCANERAGVRKIARALGMTDDSVDRIEAWIEEGVEWTSRGRAMLAKEGV